MAKLVSKIYGDALFDLCLEEQNLDAVTEEVKEVQAALQENPELMQFFMNPDICKSEKIDFVERVFKGRVSDDLVGFLRIVVTKERSNELGKILEYFTDRVKAHNKIGVATVTTPTELSDEWKAKIEKRLLDTTSFVKMEMSYGIDPGLIGGMVIRIGDTVVDSSIRTKLAELSYKLMNTSLESKN